VKYFITGIEGFVGHHLSEYLVSHGHEVSGSYFDEKTIVDLTGCCELYKIDLRSNLGIKEALAAARPQCIFHLAAQSSPAISFKKPADTFEINVIGMVNLLEAVRESAPNARILLVSSCEVYGLTNGSAPIKEEQPFNAASPYAVSKISQEQLAIQYHHTYKIDTLVARPFPHTGPGQPELFALPSFAKQIAEIMNSGKEPVVLVGNLSAKRDILDVRDVVKAYVLLSEVGRSGEIYNICSGKCLTMEWALHKLIEFSGKDIEIRIDPQRFRPLDIPILWGDNSKLKQTTGWLPEYQAEETLKALYEYWLHKSK
jgi:GDP-4-dehydro-6-deoxy-D-mannose reductase